MNNKLILIVEDEARVSSLMRDYLEKEGFKTVIQDNGDLVIAQVKKDNPDLILLDVVLPGKDGLTLCRNIRQFSNVPIIMLTARVDEIDRLHGLELGADDYVCKPFSFREVVARVKAVLRRGKSTSSVGHRIVGEVEINDETHKVLAKGEEICLTPNEFEILLILMANPNKVFSRGDLVFKVQGCDFEGYERTIDTHVKNIRKKIAKELPNQELISTVFGVGYKCNKTV